MSTDIPRASANIVSRCNDCEQYGVWLETVAAPFLVTRCPYCTISILSAIAIKAMCRLDAGDLRGAFTILCAFLSVRAVDGLGGLDSLGSITEDLVLRTGREETPDWIELHDCPEAMEEWLERGTALGTKLINNITSDEEEH